MRKGLLAALAVVLGTLLLNSGRLASAATATPT